MIDILEAYADEWRFAINVLKSVVLVFNMPLENARQLSFHIYQQMMPIVDCFKYLGVELASNLSVGKLKTRMLDNANRTVSMLLSVENARRFMSVRAALQTYRALVRSQMEYATPVWCDGVDEWKEAEQVQS